MIFEEFDAYVDTFDHVQEVRLQYQRFTRVIQHSCCMLKFLEILQTGINLIRELQQIVLVEVRFSNFHISWVRTYPLFQQPFTCILKASTTFFHHSPIFKHPIYLLFYRIYPLQ